MFEIYLNPEIASADNSQGLLTTLISVILTAILTAIVSTGIVLFSHKKEKERKIEQDRKLEIENLQYVLNLCIFSFYAFTAFKQSLENFCDKNDTKVRSEPRIEEFPLAMRNNLYRLCKGIDQERAYHAYVNQFGTKEILEIFIYFDGVLETIEFYKSSYDIIYDLVINSIQLNDEQFTDIVVEAANQNDQYLIPESTIDQFGEYNSKGYITYYELSDLEKSIKLKLPFQFVKRNIKVQSKLKLHLTYSQGVLKDNVINQYGILDRLIDGFEDKLLKLNDKDSNNSRSGRNSV